MAKKGFDYKWLIVLAVIGLAIYGWQSGWFVPAPAGVTPFAPTTTVPAQGYPVGHLSTLYFPVAEKLTGTTFATGVNAEIWKSDNTPLVAEFQVDAYPDSQGNLPNTLNGFIMVGNDNGVSSSDRGAEVYYHKQPFSYSNEGAPTLPIIYVYNESTSVSYTGYDDGTLEATTNVTIGTGESITSTEIKIKSAADTCVGNKDFSRPLAVCFNATNATLADQFDEVRPVSYDSKIPVPGFLSGKQIIGSDCFVLPTDALCDYEEYRFYIVLDAKSTSDPAANPTPASSVCMLLLDKTYYKNDQGVWEVGWEDASDLVSDSDIGIDTDANHKAIFIN